MSADAQWLLEARIVPGPKPRDLTWQEFRRARLLPK